MFLMKSGTVIALETVQDLYKSIPSKKQAVLLANGGPTPY